MKAIMIVSLIFLVGCSSGFDAGKIGLLKDHYEVKPGETIEIPFIIRFEEGKESTVSLRVFKDIEEMKVHGTSAFFYDPLPREIKADTKIEDLIEYTAPKNAEEGTTAYTLKLYLPKGLTPQEAIYINYDDSINNIYAKRDVYITVI
jgi:hypothetical protein